MSEENLTNYTVRQGDCIASIAAKTGFLWTTIWEHSANSELKNLRKDPNILHPGDVVVIPSKELEEVSCSTETLHNFVLKKTLTKLRLKLLENDEPRGNEKYILLIDGIKFEGLTKSDGSLEHPISPIAKKGELTLSPDNPKKMQVYDLKLGKLNPIKEISGVQGRLFNLGFFVEISGKIDNATIEALKSFQEKHNISVTGKIDEETTNKLRELYGC